MKLPQLVAARRPYQGKVEGAEELSIGSNHAPTTVIYNSSPERVVTLMNELRLVNQIPLAEPLSNGLQETEWNPRESGSKKNFALLIGDRLASTEKRFDA